MLSRLDENRQGYTLLEMLAVTVIIAVLASIVVGRLQNSRTGIQFQRGIQGIESAANKARSQAIRTGETYELTFDNSTQSLKVAVLETTQSASTTPKVTPTKPTSTATGDTSLGSGWSVNEVRKADGTTTQSDLSIKFYADGTAETKSVEFLNGKAPVTLNVQQNGNIEVKRGALADAKPQEWEAGNIEQRTN
jgi:prepilin-type N-terminal cleavage/methylation domain-containing protein